MIARLSLLFVALMGCEPQEAADGVPEATTCDACHRSADTPKSEPDTSWETQIPQVVSDGHDLHQARGIGCEACHVVPAHVAEPAHIDDPPAEVVFSGKAVDGDAPATWNAETGQCAGTYCHGGTMVGGIRTAPGWTDQAVGSLCNDCHGSPPDSGAHLRHFQKNVACQECHTVPISAAQPGHIDRYPADITFGAGASRDGARPIFTSATKRCDGTYCHGATKTGGIETAPTWRPPVGVDAECNSCHGFPPVDANHSPGTDTCYICHTYTLNSDDTINTQNGYHINGEPNSDLTMP